MALPAPGWPPLGAGRPLEHWIDQATGEVVESYTMLTVNADRHPVMSRMHKPDPRLSPDQQDKRSVVAIEPRDVARWLHDGDPELLVAPAAGQIDAGPA